MRARLEVDISSPSRALTITIAASLPSPPPPTLYSALYHCNYCHRDISNEVRVKCADCADFDLCLDCFSVGAEVSPHQNAHRYRVIDDLSFPVLHPDWGADEELLLLEGVDGAFVFFLPKGREGVGEAGGRGLFVVALN